MKTTSDLRITTLSCVLLSDNEPNLVSVYKKMYLCSNGNISVYDNHLYPIESVKYKAFFFFKKFFIIHYYF